MRGSSSWRSLEPSGGATNPLWLIAICAASFSFIVAHERSSRVVSLLARLFLRLACCAPSRGPRALLCHQIAYKLGRPSALRGKIELPSRAGLLLLLLRICASAFVRSLEPRDNLLWRADTKRSRRARSSPAKTSGATNSVVILAFVSQLLVEARACRHTPSDSCESECSLVDCGRPLSLAREEVERRRKKSKQRQERRSSRRAIAHKLASALASTSRTRSSAPKPTRRIEKSHEPRQLR